MRNRKIVYLILIIIILICMQLFKNLKKDSMQNKEDITSWVVDWDLKRGIEETKNLYKDFSSIQVFACYFNEQGEIFLPENLKQEILKEEKQVYITVVNDVIKDNGESIQKDNKVIRDILTDNNRKKEHIKQLIDLVDKGKFEGIELDYEKIDDDIWEDYAKFIDELGKELKKKDKKLRIILEPSSPIDKIKLPKDYEYVVMAYNLYGYHSEPGPKADKEFIKNLCNKSKENLKDVRIAFSLGGFDWGKDKTKALTNLDIKEILENKEVKINRDEKSEALYFKYIDKKSEEHTVWYSDETTIKSWINISKEYGIDKFALWRLGGNL